MRGRIPIRGLLLMAGLVFAWCALWGGISVANLASGVLVSAAVVWAGAMNRSVRVPTLRGGVDLVALIRLCRLVAWDLAKSTVYVVWEVLTSTDHTDEVVIEVEIPEEARRHLLLLVIGITVTPGTAVVDADAETGVLRLHLLHQSRQADVEAGATKLAQLACAAFPDTPAAPAADTGADAERSRP